MLKHPTLPWVVAAGLSLALSAPVGAQVTAVNGKIAYTASDYNPDVGQSTCDIWVMPRRLGAEQPDQQA